MEGHLCIATAVSWAARYAKRYTVHALGLTWEVLEHGQGGPALVFFPDVLGTVEIFSQQLMLFSESRRVVILGYPSGAGPDRMADSFFQVISQIGLANDIYIGAGLGGYWLQVLSQRRDDFMRCLILANSLTGHELIQNPPDLARKILAGKLGHEYKEVWMTYMEALTPSQQRAVRLSMILPFQTSMRVSNGILQSEIKSSISTQRITIITSEDIELIQHTEALGFRYSDAHSVSVSGGQYSYLTEPHQFNKILEAIVARARE